MDHAEFQIAAVELAREGTPLTVANVVAQLRIGASEAERHLDRMEQEGRIERDADASFGVVVYQVRGLTMGPRGASLTDAVRGAALGSLLQQRLGSALGSSDAIRDGTGLRRARKVSVGVLVGGLVPGLGLAYAAPWKVVALATVTVVAGFKILAFVSLLFAVPFLLAAAVISAILGGLYTWQFNQSGRRLPLNRDPDLRRRLPSRLKQL